MVENLAGELLVVFEQRGVIAGAVAVVVRRLHHFEHGLGQRDGRVHGPGGVHHVARVLDVQVDAEAGPEILLYAFAYNVEKWHAKIQQNRSKTMLFVPDTA